MKDDYRRQIETLRQQADGLPQGPARMALLEEAVRLADTHQDLDLGFYLRYDVAQTATFGGMAEKLLVAFSWRLAQCDRHPERFNEFRLMWEYKWVAAKLLPRKYGDRTLSEHTGAMKVTLEDLVCGAGTD